MTIAAFKGTCPTCGHDHDADNAEFQRLLKAPAPKSPAKEHPQLSRLSTLCPECGATGEHWDDCPRKSAKEQPGENQRAVPGEHQADTNRSAPVSAPDVAAMVERLNEAAEYFEQSQHKARWDYTIEKEKDIANSLRQAAALIEKLGQGWIPVSKPFERYPSSAELVLVTTEHPDEPIRLGYHLSGQWRIMSHDSKAFLVDSKYPITHWMPLPPPPERS